MRPTHHSNALLMLSVFLFLLLVAALAAVRVMIEPAALHDPLGDNLSPLPGATPR